jgi:CRP-like cAMP-binding protein
MAEYLGCERSALSRLLSEMAKKGLITYHRNRFVLNPKKKK